MLSLLSLLHYVPAQSKVSKNNFKKSMDSIDSAEASTVSYITSSDRYQTKQKDDINYDFVSGVRTKEKNCCTANKMNSEKSGIFMSLKGAIFEENSDGREIIAANDEYREKQRQNHKKNDSRKKIEDNFIRKKWEDKLSQREDNFWKFYCDT